MSAARLTVSERSPATGRCSVVLVMLGCKLRSLTRRPPADPADVTRASR